MPDRGYTQVLEFAQAFKSPSRAMYRRLDPQPRLHTGVWSPSRGYTWVFGVATAATHGCLESQTGDCASCQGVLSLKSWLSGAVSDQLTQLAVQDYGADVLPYLVKLSDAEGPAMQALALH